MGFGYPPMVDQLGNRRWLYGHGRPALGNNTFYDNGPPEVEFPGLVGGGVGGGAQPLYASRGSPGHVLFNSCNPVGFQFFFTAVPLRIGMKYGALTYQQSIPQPPGPT